MKQTTQITELRTGLDVGSTTVKLVITDLENNILFSRYERHLSNVKAAAINILKEALSTVSPNSNTTFTITGSAGMGLAELIDAPFVQEVIACTEAVEQLIPETDVVIELGGEDSKITFLQNGIEQKMNGSCAGGTGAFIDQIAVLLDTDAAGVNTLAKTAKTIYPIASRCGVFAKTDVQPLLNQGARKEDISLSILQAVVTQTIAGLASGRKISGKVAFLGGPLFFLDELRNRFIQTLNLAKEDVIFPENSIYYVALGAAIYSKDSKVLTLNHIITSLEEHDASITTSTSTLEPLFKNEAELEEFRKRHSQATATTKDLATYQGTAFLGIDAGSTTTKLALIDKEGNILYSYYGSNKGAPVETVISILKELYKILPKTVTIGRGTVTGYGEDIIKNALKIDEGIVETMAHFKAANHFLPGVDFILDIGGQDMKAMKIKDNALSSILLNEACSSGCGSFIETFANSLNYSIEDFVDAAIRSKAPADLGTKCTVFMNSKVKQVQKEGHSVGDISAGLAYSVIKNSLYKVIKVRHPEDLGKKIVCQGGTFYNEAVLRAFEKISGMEVVRPSIAGLMGAYGAAIYAQEQYEKKTASTILGFDDLESFKSDKSFKNCNLCENKCLLTVTHFSDGRNFISGNRCERGAQIEVSKDSQRTNLVEYRYKRLFQYKPLPLSQSPRGTLGIPRALNIYDNYPLWFTIFTELGFRVQLSPRSNKKIFEKGIDSIPSDTVCYPAKISHGHIRALIETGCTSIFFPSVVYEKKEFEESNNNYNCYVVQGYPNLIKYNTEEIVQKQITYHCPTLNLTNEANTVEELLKDFADLGITKEEMESAVHNGFIELQNFRNDIKQKGEETLSLINETGQRGIVLAGRPYHIDPEINHGISKIITQEGFHVLTEDSICQLGDIKDLWVINQWEYASRLFAAAKVAGTNKNLELVQLNSFGCGLDATSSDQLKEILEPYGKTATVLKIDEGTNLGAVKIRLRSLKVSILEKEKTKQTFEPVIPTNEPVLFTQNLKAKHTILVPNYGAPIRQHGLIDIAYQAAGYHVEILPPLNTEALNIGLKYVNNDYCHPPVDYVGQLVYALQTGKYDLENTSIMLADPGKNCSCRGANFTTVLAKAIADAGYREIPIIDQPMSFKHYSTDPSKPGLILTHSLLKSLALAGSYGDLFERLVFRTRPYEITKGHIDSLQKKWLKKIEANVRNGSLSEFRKNMLAMVEEFDTVPLLNIEKPRVGVVGDYGLTINYSSTAKDVVRLLEEEGVEVIIPGFGFMSTYLIKELGEDMKDFAQEYFEECEESMDNALRNSKRFTKFYSIFDMQDEANIMAPFANYDNEFVFLMGGKMLELLKDGVNNIVLYQAFNCAINYVVGVGLNKALKERYPAANIVNIDYDPGMSMVNSVNRIRLMISAAKKQMSKEPKAI